MNDGCSVFQAEISVILKAIEAVVGGPASVSELYMIFVHSQATLRPIGSVWSKSQLVSECKDSLRAFGPDRICLCWVTGHSGILGNETADSSDSLSDGDLIGVPDTQSAIPTASSMDGSGKRAEVLEKRFGLLSFYMSTACYRQCMNRLSVGLEKGQYKVGYRIFHGIDGDLEQIPAGLLQDMVRWGGVGESQAPLL